MLSVRYTPIIHDGLVLTYADITARKDAERHAAQKEAQLNVALDSMPGALAYTDDAFNIVICNDRFADMYPVPRELFEPGRSYPALLRHLALHGYYGEGDVDELVARRVESLRNPSGLAFEDRTPDGRVYRILRRRAAAGGTVTVITDITDFKRAEERMLRNEAVLHVALDNMPGALAYTDDAFDIVVRNDRFAEMYPVPRRCSNLAGPIRRSSAIWPSTATTVMATSSRWSPRGSRACATLPGARSRTTRRMVASIESRAAVPPAAARSPPSPTSPNLSSRKCACRRPSPGPRTRTGS